MQTINLGHGTTKMIDISLETLLVSCIKVLDETEKIKAQFTSEFPHL